MVLEKGPPFKTTLHSDLSDSKHAMSIPVFLSCTVLGKGREHCTDLIVPSSSSILGLEIRNIEFSASSDLNPNLPLSAYLFVQLLDGKSRPTSHPFPVASCDVSRGERLSTPVILPFQSGQRVRFYLVQRNAKGEGQPEDAVCVTGLRFIGVVKLLSMGVQKKLKTKRQVDALSQNILEFKLDKKREERIPSKRKREPGHTQEEDFIVTESPCNASKSNVIIDEDKDGPPNLLYAFVPGGDDES